MLLGSLTVLFQLLLDFVRWRAWVWVLVTPYPVTR